MRCIHAKLCIRLTVTMPDCTHHANDGGKNLHTGHMALTSETGTSKGSMHDL